MELADDDRRSTWPRPYGRRSRRLLPSLVQGGPALADSDNYTAAQGDCDVFDSSINPGEEELLDDGVDNDCDGLTDVLRQPFFRGWWKSGVGWFKDSAMSFNGDTVYFPAAGGVLWRDIDATDYLDWDNGALVVTVSLDAIASANCQLEVDAKDRDGSVHSRSESLNNSNIDNGVTVVKFGDDTSTGLGPRPLEIQHLAVYCVNGSGTKLLDWITVSNGEYGVTGAVPPVVDVRLDFDTMSAPFGGQQTTVIAGYDIDAESGLAKRLVTGSDNGGTAMTINESGSDFRWKDINGDGDVLTDNSEYAVWSVWADGPTNIFTTSGELRNGKIRGRMRNGDGITESWSEISPYYESTRTREHLATFGMGDPWNWSDSSATQVRADSGGDMMITWSPDVDDLLVASHYWIDNATYNGMGVFQVDISAATDCTTGTPFTGLPDGPGSMHTETDGLISALAVADDSEGNPSLYVGYKLRPENSDALFACALPATSTTTTCGETLSCAALPDTGWDIRDIVVTDDVLFIADAGRRWALDGASEYTETDTVEAQVYAYDAGSSLEVWQLDSTDAWPADSWDEPSDSSLSYPDFDGLLDGSGNLRPTPGGELTSLSISPEVGSDETRYLFAFFDQGRSIERYEYPPVYRARIAGDTETASSYIPDTVTCDTATPPVCELAWVPMRDYSGAKHADASQDDWDSNKAERTTAVEAQTELNWHVVDQEIDYGWYPTGAVDSMFMDLGGVETLVVSGQMGVYYLSAEDSASSPKVPGWDSAYVKSTATLSDDDLDLDNLAWGFGNADDSDFQQQVATDIAWCSDCTSSTHPEGAVTTDGMGWFGMWDLGLGRIWGNATSGARPRAAVDCQLDVLRAPSKVVEYWSDGTDSVLWAGLWTQANGSDRGGVLRSEDEGQTFCYEITSDRRTTFTSRSPAWIDTLDDDLLCREGGTGAGDPAWPPCDSSLLTTPGTMWSPDGELGTPLGSTMGIAIARHDLAFALTYDRQGDDTSLGALVVLEGDSTTGLSDLAGSHKRIIVDSNTTGNPSTDCDDLTWNQLFDEPGLFVRISPASQAPSEPTCETSGGCELVIGFDRVSDGDSGDAGATCSLFHVTVTQSAGVWSSTWESLILDEGANTPSTSCDIEDSKLTNAVIPVWAPETVFVVGKGHAVVSAGGMCSFDLTTDSFIEQVVDADRNNANIASITAHPHVENILYFGSYRDYVQKYDSDAPGIFQVSLMKDHVNGVDFWVTGQITTVNLTHPAFLDLELGLLAGSVEYLFGATNGNGPVEGLFCQEAQEDCE